MCAFYRDDSQQLCVDGLSLAKITATYGSPLYVYSGAGITEAFTQFQAAVAPVSGKVHFAMKANSALGVLALIGRLGGGMDIVSSGELARAQAAGIDPQMWCFPALAKPMMISAKHWRVALFKSMPNRFPKLPRLVRLPPIWALWHPLPCG